MMLNAFLTVFLCITFLVIISHDVVHGSFIAGPTAQRSSVLVPVPRPHMARSIHSVQEKTRETTLYLGQVARRDLLIGWVPLITASVFYRPYVAVAAVERESLDFLLYRIMRVREATQQETRLITTGKFNDVQRANVKLAIKFMVENYRLNDAFIAAATYIPDATTSTKLEAGQIGQRAVQNLYTILEYFDSADVQNLKVSLSLFFSVFSHFGFGTFLSSCST